MRSRLSDSTIVLLIIASTVIIRVAEFIPNVAPMTALAVFGAWALRSKRLCFFLPVAAMLVGDVALAVKHMDWGYAIHGTQLAVYGSMLATTYISSLLSRGSSMSARAASVVAGSTLFFVVTNFAVWAQPGMYAWTLDGLIQCYTMAIPFFRNSFIADIAYSCAMFLAFALASRTELAPARVQQRGR